MNEKIEGINMNLVEEKTSTISNLIIFPINISFSDNSSFENTFLNKT